MRIVHSMPPSANEIAKLSKPNKPYAVRLFGYDIFISFALGPPPRGTRNYAIDLVRRLRELNFTVFFSEDETSVDDNLNDVIRAALDRSRALLVIINIGTLQEPGWVRKEVEYFKQRHPDKAVMKISVDHVHEEPELNNTTQEWLDFEGKIWIDETTVAVADGIASNDVVNRIAVGLRRTRSNEKWKWLVRTVMSIIFVLMIVAFYYASESNKSRKVAEDKTKVAEDKTIIATNATAEANKQTVIADNARKNAEEEKSVAQKATEEKRKQILISESRRIMAEAQYMLSGGHSDRLNGVPEHALLGILAAHRIAPRTETEIALFQVASQFRGRQKIKSIRNLGIPMKSNASGSRIIVTRQGGSLSLADTISGRYIGKSLEGENGEIVSYAVSSDNKKIVTGDVRGGLLMWDANSGKKLGKSMFTSKTKLRSVAFDYWGRYVVARGDDGLISLWDTNTCKKISEVMDNTGIGITSIAVSSDGLRVISEGPDYIRLWNTSTSVATEIHKSDEKSADVYPKTPNLDDAKFDPWINAPVAFTPDGQRFVTSCDDISLCVWMSSDGKNLKKFKADEKDENIISFSSRVNSIAFSSDGNRMVSGANDLRIWDTKDFSILGNPMEGDLGGVLSVAFSSDNSSIISRGRDSISWWDVSRFTRAKDKFEPEMGGFEWPAFPNPLAFSIDGLQVATSGPKNTIVLWDATLHRTIGNPMIGHTKPVNKLIFSLDGNFLLSHDNDNVLRLWDTKTHQPFGLPLNGVPDSNTLLALTHDGRRMVVGNADETTPPIFWKTESNPRIAKPLIGHQAEVTSAAFSPDGTRILTGGNDKAVVLWNGITGELIRIIGWHDHEVTAVAFGPKGIIASGGRFGELKLWNTKTHETITPISEGYQPIGSIAFSTDGKYVLVGKGNDIHVYSYDKVTKSLKINGTPLQGHRGPVMRVGISEDGRWIFSESEMMSEYPPRQDRTLTWPMPGTSDEVLCKQLTRNMSHKEWRDWLTSPDIPYVSQCPGLPIPLDLEMN